MPISYSCPHCGKQFSVADQFAGQTGPCAACGQTITIPMGLAGPGQGYYQPRPSGGGGASLAVIIGAIVVVLLLVPGVLIALLLPAVGAARQAARRSQSSNNMKQLALAIHNYHDVHNCLPPAVVTDANGTPLYSGRVLLLPFLEQAAMYDMWNKNEAWNSPANKPLADTMIATFHDPADTGPPSQTSYLFVAGKGTMFEEVGKPLKFSDVTDGLSNTIMFVEVKSSGIQWAEPRDWDAAMTLPPGNHQAGTIMAFGDGSVRSVHSSTPASSIQAAASRAGGEPVYLP